MKTFRKKTETILNKARKGFSLVELLIAVVVLGILSSMLIAAGTASQNKARMSVAQNDLDSMKNSIYQALMAHPNLMRMQDVTDGVTTDIAQRNFEQLLVYLNAELDDAWQLTKVAGFNGGSGLAFQTATQKDPWGSPYGVYVYTNAHTTGYMSDDYTTGGDVNARLTDTDSTMYIVVVSSGRNGTGGPNGATGENLQTDGTFESSNAALNNSDGVDDLGTIIRLKNGTLRTASFGTDQATLGSLSGYQWIYGACSNGNGSYWDFKGNTGKTTVSCAASIDACYDINTVAAADTMIGADGVIGIWS